MPLYEYECTECRRHTEKIQKFSDPEITTCPYCGGELKRVISAPAFSLKGGGWYADGYGSAKPPSAASEGASESGGKDSPKDGVAKEGGAKEGVDKEGGAKPATTDTGTAASAPASVASPAAAPSPSPAAPASKS